MQTATMRDIWSVAWTMAQAYSRRRRHPNLWAALSLPFHACIAAIYIPARQLFHYPRQTAVIITPAGNFGSPLVAISFLVVVFAMIASTALWPGTAPTILLTLAIGSCSFVLGAISSTGKHPKGTKESALRKRLKSTSEPSYIFYSLARRTSAPAGSAAALLNKALIQVGACSKAVGCIAHNESLIPYYESLGMSRLGSTHMMLTSHWGETK